MSDTRDAVFAAPTTARDPGSVPTCGGCRRAIKRGEALMAPDAHAPGACPADVALRSSHGQAAIASAIASMDAVLDLRERQDRGGRRCDLG